MNFFRHFFVWFIPFIIFVMLEIFFFFYSQNPSILYWFLTFLICIIIFGVKTIIGKASFGETLLFLLTPLFLGLSQFLFVLFLEGWLLRHIIAVVPSIILGVFLENTFLRYHNREKYLEYSMGNILSFLNIVILYMFSAVFFGFIVYIEFEIWMATFLVTIILFCLTFQVMHLQGVALSKSWTYIFILSLVCAEFFWVINFLPSSIYVNAIILTIIYYSMIGISKNFLLGILNRSIVLRYLGISAICLLIVFFTAKWS